MQNSLEDLLRKWSLASLPSLQKLLDTQSLEIFQSQQQSLDSRKRLANLTRDFKKQQSPSVAEFKILLKEYQQEIDLLHKRSKAVEGYFLSVYKVLVELPDPLIYLEKFRDQQDLEKTSTDLLGENRRLVGVVEGLENRIAVLNDDMKRNADLKEQLQELQSMMESKVQEKAHEMVSEMKSEMEERINSHKETEYALQRQLQNLQAQFLALKSSQDFTTATTNVEAASSFAEIEVLTNEIEKCNAKISLLSTENFSLREEVKRLGDTANTNTIIANFEKEQKSAQTAISDLKLKLESTESNQISIITDYKAQIQALDRHIAKLNTEVASLNTLLVEYSDYEQVKKELEIFRDMEGGGDAPLERMVLEKNKKLENENIDLKNECKVLSEDLVSAKNIITAVNENLFAKTNLIVKLEKDIQQLNDMRANSPSENIELLIAPQKSVDSIVPILTSQRDRYRQRFEQSQRTVQELSAKLTSIQDQMSRLQQDNVVLYEKLRYQESYNGSSTSVNMVDDVSTRYRDKYESTIDPFRHFKQEESRRASNLSPADRLAMQVTKILTSNKYTRLVFVIYAGLLHLLVFVALFEIMGSRTSNYNLPFPNKPDS